MTAITDEDKKIMVSVLMQMREDMERPDYTPHKYKGQFSHLEGKELEEGIKAIVKVYIESLHKGLSDEEIEEISYKAGADYLSTLEREQDQKPECKALKSKNFIDFEPAFSEEEMYKSESEHNTTWGVNRRAMMVILSKSGREMVEMVESMAAEEEGMETFFEMIHLLSDYEQYLRAGLELVKTAQARLLMAGQCVAGDDSNLVATA